MADSGAEASFVDRTWVTRNYLISISISLLALETNKLTVDWLVVCAGVSLKQAISGPSSGAQLHFSDLGYTIVMA